MSVSGLGTPAPALALEAPSTTGVGARKAPGVQADAARERGKEQAARIEAAHKFEAVLVQQLLQVMRQTAKGGGLGSSEGASGQYMSMFDEVIAEKLAEGGGIGLSSTLVQALGGDPDASQPLVTTGLPRGSAVSGITTSAHGGVSAPLPTLQGATARLAQAAYAISARDAGKQWAKDGTLSPEDLASQIATPSKDNDQGTAHFNVLDAKGFKDEYKCNLFAFEAARRAGFEVPVVARARGWGFPTSNVVTEDAQDGSLKGGWAEVIGAEQVGDLQQKLQRGELAVMLTGAGADGRHGHMAVVERIHHVELDKDGGVKRIEFDGYEARADGAQHLLRRSWNRYGSGTDQPLARNGFGKIEVLALKPSSKPETPEVPVSSAARASLKDFSSRSR